jgi:hypothetical protein
VYWNATPLTIVSPRSNFTSRDILPILDHITDREDPFKGVHASSRRSVAVHSFGAVERFQSAAQQARFADRDGLEAEAASSHP